MDKFAVTYKEEILGKNKSIEIDGFTSIEFENIGSVNARINSAILPAGSFPRKYENQPGCQIISQFSIAFEPGLDKQILVRKTFYTKIQ